WRIVAIGHRPKDFLGRDCLYGSLWRDHRVPWFRRYLKKPAPWMEALVDHLGDKSDRRQALQCVVLDYLHKLHLARLYPILQYQYGEGCEHNLFRRLWRCTPYTVQVERRNGGKKNIRGCGYARLCPWCHARKVVQLYEVIRQGPLKQTGGKYLLLGKPKPFAEPFCGIDGSWEQADWLSYTQGETVRGHYSRYFGCVPGRAAETRKVLAKALLDAATDLGAENGLLTHQLGSAQLKSGQRTFLHDLGLIAELNEEKAQDLQSMAGEDPLWKGIAPLESLKALELRIRWLLLPADHSSALRVALAGSSSKFLRKRLGLLENDAAYSAGIEGALSWQPTFLFDDEMWFPYLQEIQNRRLHRPFGSWRGSMTAAAADARKSIDRKFKEVQAERHARKRQQA